MIGPDLTITGNLISKGEVQVDGIVEGDIHGSHVVIGETATISGGIVADEVVVRGHVVGISPLEARDAAGDQPSRRRHLSISRCRSSRARCLKASRAAPPKIRAR